MGLSRQENWSGLSFPPPRDLPNPGIEPRYPASPALADGFFITEPPGKPFLNSRLHQIVICFGSGFPEANVKLGFDTEVTVEQSRQAIKQAITVRVVSAGTGENKALGEPQ